MNSEIIAVARGANGGFFGRKSKACRSNSGFTGSASSRSFLSSHANATDPTPKVEERSQSRREMECMLVSVHKQKLAGVQQHPANRDHGLLLGVEDRFLGGRLGGVVAVVLFKLANVR